MQQATPEQIWGPYEPLPESSEPLTMAEMVLAAQQEEEEMANKTSSVGSPEWMAARPWLSTAKSPWAPKPFLQEGNGAGWQQWIWPAAIVGGAFLLFSALRR